MNRKILLILLTLASSSTIAAMGEVTSFLSNDKVTSLDFGIYKLDLKVKEIQENFKNKSISDFRIENGFDLDRYNGESVVYDLEKDTIIISSSLRFRDSKYTGRGNTPTDFTEKDLFPLCRYIMAKIQNDLGLAHDSYFFRENALEKEAAEADVNYLVSILRPDYFEMIAPPKTKADEDSDSGFDLFYKEIQESILKGKQKEFIQKYFGHSGYVLKDAPENWGMELLKRMTVKTTVLTVIDKDPVKVTCNNTLDKDFYREEPMHATKRDWD